MIRIIPTFSPNAALIRERLRDRKRRRERVNRTTVTITTSTTVAFLYDAPLETCTERTSRTGFVPVRLEESVRALQRRSNWRKLSTGLVGDGTTSSSRLCLMMMPVKTVSSHSRSRDHERYTRQI